MELEELRSILKNSQVDLWTFIDTAISVAILDHENELRNRRDAIVEKLYSLPQLCKNCNSVGNYETPESIDDHKLKAEEKSSEEYEDAENKILRIKKLLENPNQCESSLVELLQSLAEMEISFKVLEKTDVGRHVNRLRKHSSNEVRRLVKLLIRRWKDIVDEWVRLNTPVEETGDGVCCPPLINNFQERSHFHGNRTSSSYYDQKSVEKNNIGPSSKRLREEHHGKMQRTREVDFQHVQKIKKSVEFNGTSGFQAKYW